MQLFRCVFLMFLFGRALEAQLQFADPNADWSSRPPAVASDSASNTYVVSNTQALLGVTATKSDPNGKVLYSYSFAVNQEAMPMAAAADSQGNLWVAGWTNSGAFPLVKPLLHPLVPDANSHAPIQGFLVKVNAAGTALAFSTLVGGNDPSPPFAAHEFGFTSSVTAVAVDRDDNVYAVGATLSPTFPVTANAFQKTGGGLSDPTQLEVSDVRMSTFVMKISSAGDKLLYSTYLGGQMRVCAFNGCSAAVPNAVAVDAQGRATVAGMTLQPDFPVTPGAYQTDCHCAFAHGSVFVTRLTADGSGLEWSTFVSDGDNLQYNGFVSSGSCVGMCVTGLVLDGQGNAIVAGVTQSTTFPVTPGAVQGTNNAVPVQTNLSRDTGFVASIGSDGSSLLHATYFGGTLTSQLNGLSQDSAGNLWITGTLSEGGDYVTALDPTLSKVVMNYRMPNGGAGATIHDLPNHSLLLTGPSNAKLVLPENGPQGPSVWGVAGAAEPAVTMQIAPGEVISLYGANLGVKPSVTVGGIAAPLLYAGPNQINLVVPFSVSGAPVIEVTTATGTASVTGMQMVATRPQIFPAIVNQDGTINSPANPAPRGSVVTMWATGGGAMTGGMVDGQVSEPPLGKVIASAEVLLTRLSPADLGVVTYAGAAPGMVAGVVQINFQVPPAHQGYGSCHFSCAVILSLDYMRSLMPDLRLSVPD